MAQQNDLVAILLNQNTDHTKNNKGHLEKKKLSDSDNNIDVINVDTMGKKVNPAKAKKDLITFFVKLIYQI